MARKKIKNTTDQRPFIMLYHDVIDSNLLDMHELVVFIGLKKFTDDKNQCFPSLKKLEKVTRMSKRKIQDTLKSLEEKHIIEIENRTRLDGGNSSNLYKLNDYKEVWAAGNTEEVIKAIDEIEEKQMIEALTAKGYHISKEKELVSEPSKAHSQAQQNNNMYTQKDTTKKTGSQDRYSLEEIQQLYEYDILLQDNPGSKENIDAVMAVLYDALNTQKETIRIGRENRPAMSVIGKLMKLTYLDISYAMEKFSSQTERIKNPAAYLLTILYGAKEQSQLEAKNRVAHDMTRGKVD